MRVVTSTSLSLTSIAGEAVAPATLPADEPILIGRALACAMRLPHASVSKKHAQLHRTDDGWFVTDLQSLNGTTVNGERIDTGVPIALSDGAALGIGVCLFRIGPGAGRDGEIRLEVNRTATYATRATMFLRLRQDDAEARELSWREFSDRYRPVIVGFARRAGMSASDAEDVLQEVILGFFQAHEGIEYDPARGRFRGYLKKATLNVIRKKARKERLMVPFDDGVGDRADDDSDATWERAWSTQIMHRALQQVRDQFDDRTWEAFELYAQRGVPADAVAERLGMAVNSVHQAKSRVLKAVAPIVQQLRDAEG